MCSCETVFGKGYLGLDLGLAIFSHEILLYFVEVFFLSLNIRNVENCPYYTNFKCSIEKKCVGVRIG